MGYSMRSILGMMVLLGCMQAGAQTPPAKPATPPAAEPADQPAPKMRGNVHDPHFIEMHNSFVRRARECPIGLLFLGDSITEGWNRAYDVWKEHYWKYYPADFGIGGDRTQHVLWRMDNGEISGIDPKVVVVMIGTNNLGANPPEQIAAADKKIVDELHEKLPNTKVLLLGIFPRGADPNDSKVAWQRETIKKINTELAKLDDGSKTRYLDIGDKFLGEAGLLPKDIMPDALHPNEKGYQIWADAMQPTLDEMMK